MASGLLQLCRRHRQVEGRRPCSHFVWSRCPRDALRTTIGVGSTRQQSARTSHLDPQGLEPLAWGCLPAREKDDVFQVTYYILFVWPIAECYLLSGRACRCAADGMDIKSCSSSYHYNDARGKGNLSDNVLLPVSSTYCECGHIWGKISWLRPEKSRNRFTLHFGGAARIWRRRQISRDSLLYLR
jgi:hypothetical protein